MDVKATYTIEQCIDYMGMGKFQWRVVVVLGFCLMSDAVELMLLTVLGPALKCTWPDITDFHIALLTTCTFLGMMCGAFLFGVLGDKYGRRRVILIGASLSTLFGGSTAFAQNFYMVLLARMLDGVSVGGSSQSTTLLLEYSPSAMRGPLFALSQVFWVIGGVYVYTTAMFTVSHYGWRLLVVLCILPSLSVALSVYFLPESPRYYMARGQKEKAERIVEQIASTNKRSLPPGKLVDIDAKDECGSVKQLFHVSLRRTTFLLAYMWTTVSFGYYGIVLVYTSLLTLNNESKPSAIELNATNSTTCQMLTASDYLSLIFTTLGDLAGVLLLLLMLPRFDRRTISIINYSAGSLCFLLFLVVAHPGHLVVSLITFLTRMFLNNQFIFMYLYTVEVYPTVIRAVAVGCAMAMSRTGAMVAPYVGQVLIKQTFYGTMLIFTLTTAIAALFSCLLPIETKGQALKQTVEGTVAQLEVSDHAAGSARMTSANDITSLINVDNGGVGKKYDSLIGGKSDNAKTQ